MEKWMEGISPNDRTVDVAVSALQSRLDAVLHYLPQASEKADEDIEHVHQLRVWTRRATAALRMYKNLIRRRRFVWMKRQLKRIRRAANDARDCDVLIERLTKKQSIGGDSRWLETVRAARAKAQKTIVSVHKRLCRGHRFARRIDKLLESVRSASEETDGTAASRFGEWARNHLQPVVERFFDAIPSDPDDASALHQLRICGKELRYDMELLVGAFPDEFHTRLYPTVEAILDRLGIINDLAMTRARLRKKIKATNDKAEIASWQRLLNTEQKQLNEVRRQFWEWCTPPMRVDLWEGFMALLGNPLLVAEPRKSSPRRSPDGSAFRAARLRSVTKTTA